VSITRDQVSAAGIWSTGSSWAATWSVNPEAGSSVLIAVSLHGAATITSVTDNGTTPATFTLDLSETYGSGSTLHGSYIYRADGITLPSSGSYAVTVAMSSSSGSGSSAGVSYLGKLAGGPGTHTAVGTSTGTAVSTGSLTPPAAGYLCFAAFQDSTSLNPETITLTGSGFTQQAVNANGSAAQAMAIADQIGTPASAQACTWTLGDSVEWSAAMAAYAPAPVHGTVALSGSGVLTGAGLSLFSGAAALSGSGALGPASAAFEGAAALAGTGTAVAGGGTGGYGSAVLSGTGLMTAARSPMTLGQGAALSGTGLMTAGVAGFGQAVLSGTGVMTSIPDFEYYAALAGTGAMTAGPVRLGFSAALSGTGQLLVARVLGVIASSVFRGSERSYSWPGSSQVAVAPPGTGASWQLLGTIGEVTALTYSFTCPGGADKMTATVMVPAAYRNQAFWPGWQVRVTRGGHIVWTGKLDEPVPSASGWTLTASGTGNRGAEFLAVYTSTWPANQPDESINGAISRGMPWTNNGVGQPAGAWFGQGTDSGAQTITALLNLICTRGGLTWYVNSQFSGGVAGNQLSVFPLPTTPNRLLVAGTPVARTLGGDINTIYIRYESSAASTASGGSGSATYGLTSVQNAQSVAMHDEMETYIDLSNAGVMSAGAAQAVGNSVLAIYQRASYAGPFTGHYGDLLTMGGQPIDPGTDQAATMVQLILTDFGYGGEVTPGPAQFITGAYEWDDFAQVFTITPYQALDQSLTGLLSMESTVLAPITAASGTSGG